MKKTPLLPRSLNSDIVGISYRTFLKQKDPLSQEILDGFDIDNQYKKFDDRIQYLICSVVDLSTKKEYIQKLWNLAFKTIKANDDFLILNSQINV